MKYSSLVHAVKAGAIALSLAVLPAILPVPAQAASTNLLATTGTTDTTGTTGTSLPSDTTTTTPTTTVADTNDSFDWGWLGLLGLIGLAGLAGRNREEPTRYADPDPSTRSTTNRY